MRRQQLLRLQRQRMEVFRNFLLVLQIAQISLHLLHFVSVGLGFRFHFIKKKCKNNVRGADQQHGNKRKKAKHDEAVLSCAAR